MSNNFKRHTYDALNDGRHAFLQPMFIETKQMPALPIFLFISSNKKLTLNILVLIDGATAPVFSQTLSFA
jgi:hypothetical protein